MHLKKITTQGILAGIFLFISSVVIAGPVISGGGSQTVKSGEGRTEVVNLGESSIVYLFDEAARVLFESLEIKSKTPPYSTSVIKAKSGVECTQNKDNYFCMILVHNK